MTAERARAYTRLMHAVRDEEQSLSPSQRNRIMLAADAFLFCRSWNELEVRICLADMRRLADELMDRWAAEPLEELLDDLERCGPDRRIAPAPAWALAPAAA